MLARLYTQYLGAYSVKRIESMVVRHVFKHKVVHDHALPLVLHTTQTESLQLTRRDLGLRETLVVLVGVQQEHGTDQVLLQNVWLLEKI